MLASSSFSIAKRDVGALPRLVRRFGSKSKMSMPEMDERDPPSVVKWISNRELNKRSREGSSYRSKLLFHMDEESEPKDMEFPKKHERVKDPTRFKWKHLVDNREQSLYDKPETVKIEEYLQKDFAKRKLKQRKKHELYKHERASGSLEKDGEDAEDEARERADETVLADADTGDLPDESLPREYQDQPEEIEYKNVHIEEKEELPVATLKEKLFIANAEDIYSIENMYKVAQKVVPLHWLGGRCANREFDESLATSTSASQVLVLAQLHGSKLSSTQAVKVFHSLASFNLEGSSRTMVLEDGRFKELCEKVEVNVDLLEQSDVLRLMHSLLLLQYQPEWMSRLVDRCLSFSDTFDERQLVTAIYCVMTCRSVPAAEVLISEWKSRLAKPEPLYFTSAGALLAYKICVKLKINLDGEERLAKCINWKQLSPTDLSFLLPLVKPLPPVALPVAKRALLNCEEQHIADLTNALHQVNCLDENALTFLQLPQDHYYICKILPLLVRLSESSESAKELVQQATDETVENVQFFGGNDWVLTLTSFGQAGGDGLWEEILSRGLVLVPTLSPKQVLKAVIELTKSEASEKRDKLVQQLLERAVANPESFLPQENINELVKLLMLLPSPSVHKFWVTVLDLNKKSGLPTEVKGNLLPAIANSGEAVPMKYGKELWATFYDVPEKFAHLEKVFGTTT